jgi:GAF domain-containing protein
MVQRGVGEAREAALAANGASPSSRAGCRRFSPTPRSRSDASDALEEIVQLVAEQARDLVGGACCLTTVALGGAPRAPKGPPSHRTTGAGRRSSNGSILVAVYGLLRGAGGVVRLAGEQATPCRRFGPRPADRPLHGWLAVSLSALDGGELGAIQLFDKPGGAFDANDEAALIHLAQMASAAVDRALLYRG